MNRVSTLTLAIALSITAAVPTLAADKTPAKPADKAAKAEPVEHVKITGAWIRTTAPGASTAAVYMKMESDVPLRLIQAESDAAKSAEVHEMKMVDGVMQMRPIVPLEVAAGKVVTFKPGGYHIMLLDIKKPIKDGDLVPVMLTFVGADNKLVRTTLAAVGRPKAPDAK